VTGDRLAYPPSELARLVGRSRRTVWNWIREGKPRCVNGLIPAEDVAKLLGIEFAKRHDELDQDAERIVKELGL
jgi:hypothetical protein